VLAHKHRETAHLEMPTSDEELSSFASAFEDSLGSEFEDRFAEMLQHFDPKSVFLSLHRGWKGGIHIQSCGHHMHYDCRQSYCETLKQQMRMAREQVRQRL
jgi:E3 ubiquitin-protein ligase UBR3